jgi:tRNA(fMet)-specific endonuclease VapC
MSGRICLDTNVVIRIFRNDPLAPAFLARYSRCLLPVPVVGELLYAAKNSARARENLSVYDQFIQACTVLGITAKTAGLYSDIRMQLKRDGKPIPENDLWIAAVCMEHDLPLATADGHFDYVEGLGIYSWSVD